MAIKATLINPEGKKVVVESGSQAAQNYFGQGYQLMGASGKYVAPATTVQTPQTSIAPQQTASTTTKTPTGLTSLSQTNTTQPAQKVPAPIIQQPTVQQPTSQYGTKVPSPAELKYYNESEIVRSPDGSIYLKPGIDTRWMQTQASAATAPIQTTSTGMTKVPSPNELKYYTENEIVRNADGSIYLKSGVPVRWGKEMATTQQMQTPTAVDDLTNFEMQQQGYSGLSQFSPTPESDYQKLLAGYQTNLQQIQQPYIESQQQFMSFLQNQPSMEEYFNKVAEEQGIDAAREKINTMSGVANEIANVLESLPEDIKSRYQDIGITESQANRRYAKESIPLTKQLNEVNQTLSLLQNDYSMRMESIDRIMNYAQMDREDKQMIAQQGLQFIQENMQMQKDMLDQQLDLTMKEIESKLAAEAAQAEYERELQASDLDWQRQLALEQFKSASDYEKAIALKELDQQNDTPTSYQEWSLAGGLEGTGKTYAQWVDSTKAGSEKYSSSQYQAATFASRLSSANDIINELGSQFTGTSSVIGGILPNILKSEDRQAFEQAERNFINAVLRRESGAAIADSEFKSAEKQYFPQPGDNDTVIQQKAYNRQQALQGLVNEAGGAYNLLQKSLAGSTGVDDDVWGGLETIDFSSIISDFNNVPSTTVNGSTSPGQKQSSNSVNDYKNKISSFLSNFTSMAVNPVGTLANKAINSLKNDSIEAEISQKYPAGSTGGQCLTWLHKIADFPAIGDKKEDKYASVAKYGETRSDWLANGPKVGDIIITNEDPTWGHGAMINSITYKNGVPYATLSESNYYQKSLGAEKVSHTREIPLTSTKIYGAITPTKLKV